MQHLLIGVGGGKVAQHTDNDLEQSITGEGRERGEQDSWGGGVGERKGEETWGEIYRKWRLVYFVDWEIVFTLTRA